VSVPPAARSWSRRLSVRQNVTFTAVSVLASRTDKVQERGRELEVIEIGLQQNRPRVALRSRGALQYRSVVGLIRIGARRGSRSERCVGNQNMCCVVPMPMLFPGNDHAICSGPALPISTSSMLSTLFTPALRQHQGGSDRARREERRSHSGRSL